MLKRNPFRCGCRDFTTYKTMEIGHHRCLQFLLRGRRGNFQYAPRALFADHLICGLLDPDWRHRNPSHPSPVSVWLKYAAGTKCALGFNIENRDTSSLVLLTALRNADFDLELVFNAVDQKTALAFLRLMRRAGLGGTLTLQHLASAIDKNWVQVLRALRVGITIDGNAISRLFARAAMASNITVCRELRTWVLAINNYPGILVQCAGHTTPRMIRKLHRWGKVDARTCGAALIKLVEHARDLERRRPLGPNGPSPPTSYVPTGTSGRPRMPKVLSDQRRQRMAEAAVLLVTLGARTARPALASAERLEVVWLAEVLAPLAK